MRWRLSSREKMPSAEKRRKAYRYGLSSEKFAGIYLACKGYRVIADRYQNHFGEIDIVALKKKTLVIVEVKARKTFEACEETIAPWKQQKIARAVEGLIGGQGKIAGLVADQTRNIRFDVIWIVPWRLPRHIKDAWRL
jgi:putative endonuclease